jgi:hypothetical protein
MDTPLFSTTITNKVHKITAIQIATFLGGPLVAGYLIAENYKQIGQPEKVKKAWLWCGIAFALMLVLAYIVPESVPRLAFAAFNTIVVTIILRWIQADQIKAHIEAGGGLYSTRRAVFTSFIVCAIMFAVVLACYFILDALHIIEGY